MKIRNAAVTVGACVALALGMAAPASAAAPSRPVAHHNAARPANPQTPYASSVSFRLIVPSTLSANGAYQVEIDEVDPSPSNCSFSLYRYTDYYGSQYLGYYNGTTTTDLVQPYFGYTYYYLTPYDCSGNSGGYVYSNVFYPNTVDDAFSVVSGHASYLYASRYYGGDELVVTGLRARARWYTNDDYNTGIVGGTGPQGGIGTVYANGVRKGTINFYSARATSRKVLLKFGSGDDYYTVDIVMTKAGARRGTSMYLDAGIENRAS